MPMGFLLEVQKAQPLRRATGLTKGAKTKETAMYAFVRLSRALRVEVWTVQIRNADHSVVVSTTCMGAAGAKSWILTQRNKGVFK
jgi:hypothetical protein